MKYQVDFQYFPLGAERPVNDGIIMPHETTDQGFMLLPNVGDYVSLMHVNPDHSKFRGRVRSRYFTYFHLREELEPTCIINVVVEEVDDGVWGELIKE